MAIELKSRTSLANKSTSGNTFTEEAVHLLLFREREVAAFYHQLRYLQEKKWDSWEDEKIYKVLGISRNSYFKYRKRLVDLGLVEITEPFTARSRITFLEVIFPDELKRKVIVGEDYIIKYLPKLIDKVIQVNAPDYKKEKIKQKQLQEQQQMFEGQVEDKAKELNKKKAKKKKQEEERFPAQHYYMVLTAYSKYKGLGLKGNETVRAKHAIKEMFKAERTPKQIIDCMKRFSELKEEPEYSWLKQWTLETVMKKIPEFVAGHYSEKDSSSPLSFKEANAIMNRENDPDPSLYEKD